MGREQERERGRGRERDRKRERGMEGEGEREKGRGRKREREGEREAERERERWQELSICTPWGLDFFYGELLTRQGNINYLGVEIPWKVFSSLLQGVLSWHLPPSICLV